MNKIRNHSDIAVNYAIAYLREFEGINQYNESSGTRYQILENCLWYILNSLSVDNAEGTWLDLLGEKAGRSRQLLATPADALTLDFDSNLDGIGDGTYDPDVNGLGEVLFDGLGGNLLEGVGEAGKTYVSLQDELYRLAIKFSMVKNNFDGKRETLINAIKILTNATRVLIWDKPPLACDLLIQASIPNDYQSAIVELIKELFPQCVEIETIYEIDVTSPFTLDSSSLGLAEDSNLDGIGDEGSGGLLAVPIA